jgi:aryl-alcohol dehydrogenase-like predicted oxidoreductase
MITSHAASQATLDFSKKFPDLLYKPLGKTGLTVSACGFGGYRIDYRVKEHFDALKYAIESGINLIDTSANYSEGGSEILIGKVLDDMISKGNLMREEIVIVSKGGYIQGKNFEHAKKLKEDGHGYKEVVEYTDSLWHSIHPDFLKDQITFSLERMKLETIDVYLLHNPEYFLDSPVSKELTLEEMRHEYYIRIKKAFGYLESEVEKGRIGSYGISSNSFVYDTDTQTFTSLEECINEANKIKSGNHFYAIQFPLNLFEKGAILAKNQNAETKTLLELAKENNLGTIVNRPLNAISGRSLKRLADFEIKEEFLKLDETQIIAEINLLDTMEEMFIKENLELLELTKENTEAVNYFLKAGQLLKENWKNFDSMENFNDVKKNFLIPRVNFAFGVMIASPKITEEMKNSLDKIALQVNKLIVIIETIYGTKANIRSKELHLKLNDLLDSNEQFKPLSLSQKSMLMINSLDDISCTLVGMRQNKYVDDVIKCLKQEKIEKVIDKWKQL